MVPDVSLPVSIGKYSLDVYNFQLSQSIHFSGTRINVTWFESWFEYFLVEVFL